MIAVTVHTSMKSNLWLEGARLLREPWMAATLADFYFNIFLISLWAAYKEANVTRAVLWIFLFALLGSIATSFYVLIQVVRLKPEEPLENILLRRR